MLNLPFASINLAFLPYSLNSISFSCVPIGPEQAPDAEGSGVRDVAETSRVHSGAGVQAAGAGPAHSGRTDPHSTSERAGQSDGVQ